MKRLFLLFVLAACSISAHATTWYIRTDGGTATQCTGTTNAAYPGTGTGVACAYNHPFYLVTNNTDASAFAWKIAAGDTVQFEDEGPYYIGLGPLNGLGTDWLACGTDAVDCVLPVDIPSTAANPTRILGANAGNCHTPGHTGTTNATKLVGINGAYWMWSLQGSQSVDMECFDFSQPDTCTSVSSNYEITVQDSALSGGTATYQVEQFYGGGTILAPTERINIAGSTNGGGVLNFTNKPVATFANSTYTITSSQATGTTVTLGYTVVSGTPPAADGRQQVYLQGLTNSIPGINDQYDVASSTGGSTGTFTVVDSNATTTPLQAENGTGSNAYTGTLTVTGMGAGTVAAAADTGTVTPTGLCVQGTNNFAQTALHFAEGSNQGPANLTLKDISAHGLAARAIRGSHLNILDTDTTTISDLYMYGNGETGFDSDSGDGGTANESIGNINISHIISDWNGCIEVEPDGGVIGSAGYDDCVDQQFGGNGDAVVMVATKGTWTWSDLDLELNAQDGFDSLHMGDDLTAKPTVNSTRIYAYGNEGQSIKGGGANVTVTNSIGITNCNTFLTDSYPLNPPGWNARIGATCRANDAMVFAMADGDTLNVEYVTNISDATVSWDFSPAGVGDCTNNCIVNMKNNVTLGFLHPGGGGAYTGPVSVEMTTDPCAIAGSSCSFNSWSRIGNTGTTCPGDANETNYICPDITVTPLFVKEAAINDMNVEPIAGSPLIGAGTPISGITTDYAGNARANPPTIGAYEFMSSPATTMVFGGSALIHF